ncbi:MAG TPA: MgtC/SapB family protein, partial [Pseudomonadales bacterium]|nr:MgtC/SapB family protein [Pseudomonadales bacterium]
MIGIDLDVARDFLIALLIGALVGVEREKSQSASGHRTIAGLRTFILLAQLGSLAAWASMQYGGPALYAVALALVGFAVISGHVLESRVRPDAPGLSTEFAALTVFLLGGVVMYGHAEVAVALGILTSAVLAFKQPLHGLVARVATDDIYAVLKLLI